MTLKVIGYLGFIFCIVLTTFTFFSITLTSCSSQVGGCVPFISIVKTIEVLQWKGSALLPQPVVFIKVAHYDPLQEEMIWYCHKQWFITGQLKRINYKGQRYNFLQHIG